MVYVPLRVHRQYILKNIGRFCDLLSPGIVLEPMYAHLCHLFECCCSLHESNPKVGQKSISGTIEENIFRFDVTMNDSLLVGIVQGLSYLRDNRNSILSSWALFIWCFLAKSTTALPQAAQNEN